MPPSRRGHLSTKVPNARNRPAPAPDAGSESSLKRRRLAHDQRETEQEDDEFRRNARDADADEARAEDFEGDEPKPLRGAVICMTGIDEDKKELIRCAEFLGATVEGNLTEDATHLIATKPGSEKFRCAVRLGMHILRPAWLTDMRELWRKELPVDVDKLIDIHHLDTFEGLDFALAGFQEREDRSALRRQLMSDAGKCGQTFTLGGSHTHLICNDDAPKTSNTYGTVHEWRRKASRWERRGEQIPDPDREKPGSEGQTAAKNMRMARALKCVRREWVEDSLRIRAALDESMYLIEKPKPTEEQREAMLGDIEMQRDRLNKRWAQNRKVIDSKNNGRHASSTGASSKATNLAKESPHPESGAQASTKSTSLSKLVGQIAANKSKAPEASGSARDSRIIAASTAPPAEKSASSLTGMSREAKFVVSQAASDAKTVVAATGAPPKTAPPAPAVAASWSSATANEASTSKQGAARQVGLFAGKTVRLEVAKERFAVFEKALVGEGAKVISSADESRADYCLTSLSVGGIDRHGQSEETRGVEVTHLWLERCINARSILSLDKTPFSRPSQHPFPLPGADRLHVALTGLSDGPDCVQAHKLLTDMGVGSASSCFGRGRNTHLLTGPGAEQDEASMSANIKAKLSKAAQWEVPVRPLLSFVKGAWESGRFEPSGAPLVRSRAGSAMPSTALTSVGSTARQGLGTQSLGETQASSRSGPGALGLGHAALRRSTQSLGSESIGNMESIPERPSAELKPGADITNGESQHRSGVKEDASRKQRAAPQATPPNVENIPGPGLANRSPWQKSHSASQAEEQRELRAQEAGLRASPGRARETSLPPPRDPSAMDAAMMEETMVGASLAVDAASDDILAMISKSSRRSEGSGSGTARKKAKFARSRFRSDRAASSAGPEEKVGGLAHEGEGSPSRAEKLLASRREEDARREREARGGMADWETLQSSPGRAMQQQQAHAHHQRLLDSRAALQHLHHHHNPSISQQTQVPLHGGAAGNPSGIESLGPRVVYDDPAARKERKRIEDMIRASKSGDGGASSSASPTATKV